MSPSFSLLQITYKLEKIPVKDIIVGVALSVEECSEQLPEVRVVRLVVKPQGATEIQVCGKFSYKKNET